MEYSTLKRAVLDDPCASYWLKDAVRSLEKRDPVDAIADAEMLVKVMDLRCRESLEGFAIYHK